MLSLRSMVSDSDEVSPRVVKEFLNKYEQEKGKTVYQHLLKKLQDKNVVDQLLKPIEQKMKN